MPVGQPDPTMMALGKMGLRLSQVERALRGLIEASNAPWTQLPNLPDAMDYIHRLEKAKKEAEAVLAQPY